MLYTVQGAYDIVVSKIKKSLLSWNLNGIKTINRYFVCMHIHTHILSGNISDFFKKQDKSDGKECNFKSFKKKHSWLKCTEEWKEIASTI